MSESNTKSKTGIAKICDAKYLKWSTDIYDVYRARFSVSGNKQLWNAIHISIPHDDDRKNTLYNRGLIKKKDISAYNNKLLAQVTRGLNICGEIHNADNAKGTEHFLLPVKIEREDKEDSGVDYYIIANGNECLLKSDILSKNASVYTLVSVALRLFQIARTMADMGYHVGAFDLNDVFVQSNEDSDKKILQLGIMPLACHHGESIEPLPNQLSYIHPSLSKGGIPDIYTDIYSVFAILWVLLSNRPYGEKPDFSKEPCMSFPELTETMKRGINAETEDDIKYIRNTLHALLKKMQDKEVKNDDITVSVLPPIDVPGSTDAKPAAEKSAKTTSKAASSKKSTISNDAKNALDEQTDASEETANAQKNIAEDKAEPAVEDKTEPAAEDKAEPAAAKKDEINEETPSESAEVSENTETTAHTEGREPDNTVPEPETQSKDAQENTASDSTEEQHGDKEDNTVKVFRFVVAEQEEAPADTAVVNEEKADSKSEPEPQAAVIVPAENGTSDGKAIDATVMPEKPVDAALHLPTAEEQPINNMEVNSGAKSEDEPKYAEKAESIRADTAAEPVTPEDTTERLQQIIAQRKEEDTKEKPEDRKKRKAKKKDADLLESFGLDEESAKAYSEKIGVDDVTRLVRRHRYEQHKKAIITASCLICIILVALFLITPAGRSLIDVTGKAIAKCMLVLKEQFNQLRSDVWNMFN